MTHRVSKPAIGIQTKYCRATTKLGLPDPNCQCSHTRLLTEGIGRWNAGDNHLAIGSYLAKEALGNAEYTKNTGNFPSKSSSSLNHSQESEKTGHLPPKSFALLVQTHQVV